MTPEQLRELLVGDIEDPAELLDRVRLLQSGADDLPDGERAVVAGWLERVAAVVERHLEKGPRHGFRARVASSGGSARVHRRRCL